MAVYNSHHLKRTSSTAQLDEPAAKKLNRGPIRHHKPAWDLQREQRHNAIIQDDEAVQSMLVRSIGLALEAVGFEAAAPEAVESFRGDVEEYMAHYLADVRQSMLSCRRTQPIPQDFLQALHTHQLSLRSLIPHLKPPVPPERSQYPLQSESVQDDEHYQFQFLGPLLNGPPNEQAKAFVPKHFPEFPSKHTYKATAEFPDRESDPRRVRERATEEGRLGEEALRRLVGASSDTPAQKSLCENGPKDARTRRKQMFMETMAVFAGDGEGMEVDGDPGYKGKGRQEETDVTSMAFGSGRLHSAVNSEKRYWRKPAQQRSGGNEGS